MTKSCILKNLKFQCRVSSVFNRDVKLFGKTGMFDDNRDTCWSSDQGFPQWIQLELDKPVEITCFQIQFQGGYVGENCHLDVIPDTNSTSKIVRWQEFYPEDNNSRQEFKLDTPVTTKSLRFTFNASSDFFGRIIIYNLSLF